MIENIVDAAPAAQITDLALALTALSRPRLLEVAG
jgi:hypothetical protein